MKLDISPLGYLLKKGDIFLTVQNTPWGFFWKEGEEWPGIVKHGDRILFNLQEYSDYSISVEKEDNTLHLWLYMREKVLQYLDGKLMLTEYHDDRKRWLLYKAEVFPLSEKRLENFTELPIPVDWERWCPKGVWPDWAIEAARESVLQYVKEQKPSIPLIEYAIFHNLVGWLPENTLMQSIRFSEFDLDELRQSRKDLFDYFVQTITKCNYSKLVIAMLV